MGGWALKPGDRQAEILLCVERDGEVSVPDLAARFEVSAETIRRDLAHLAATGALQKVHGGARRVRLHVESSFEERISEQAAEKAIIAQKLRGLVSPGDTCFIDTGTTTLVCAQAIADVPELTVITNSLHIARLMGAGQGRVFLLGGNFAADNDETVGPIALAQIAQFRADYAVIGAAALDLEAGPMDANFEEAAIARAMCAHASKIIVVAGSAKYGKRALHRVCRLEDVDTIVSDKAPGEAFQAALDTAKVKLI
ncbi:DeoR family glycerol-3-phosphate regulon repressor [Aquamicrobium terrae]